MAIWNPWHGCIKYSEGCKNCYVYRRDESIGKDASIIYKTKSFDLPLKKDRKGEYKIKPGSEVYSVMTSDFFVEESDKWRDEIWEMIKLRNDVTFIIITKRIERFNKCIPLDWGSGYDNVWIICTVENQKNADKRLPIFKSLPIKHKSIASEPILSKIDMSKYLDETIKMVVAGGESGFKARICDYEWIIDIRRQCVEKNIPFWFKQTGTKLLKDGKVYTVKRVLQHSQARKSGISTVK